MDNFLKLQKSSEKYNINCIIVLSNIIVFWSLMNSKILTLLLYCPALWIVQYLLHYCSIKHYDKYMYNVHHYCIFSIGNSTTLLYNCTLLNFAWYNIYWIIVFCSVMTITIIHFIFNSVALCIGQYIYCVIVLPSLKVFVVGGVRWMKRWGG